MHTYALSRKASVCTGTEAGKGKSATNVLHVVPEDRRLTHQSFTERAELGPRDGDGYPALLAWVAGKRVREQLSSELRGFAIETNSEEAREMA